MDSPVGDGSGALRLRRYRIRLTQGVFDGRRGPWGRYCRTLGYAMILTVISPGPGFIADHVEVGLAEQGENRARVLGARNREWHPGCRVREPTAPRGHFVAGCNATPWFDDPPPGPVRPEHHPLPPSFVPGISAVLPVLFPLPVFWLRSSRHCSKKSDCPAARGEAEVASITVLTAQPTLFTREGQMMISIALPPGVLAFMTTADQISRLENLLWPIALFLLMMVILLGVLFVTGRDTPRRYRASKATAFERYERWLSARATTMS